MAMNQLAAWRSPWVPSWDALIVGHWDL
ncbi:hypothetical protein CCACVL1_14486 [Corchorus capsularis]|uniref:Uncharacterized protein n=1 Tax=Corchorus capsularis TaxID=210143 RepID=A0A1R3I6Y5_COCAP|nr:hypothetical protein CCACVL1_14486 [Corchorus capsularis]